MKNLLKLFICFAAFLFVFQSHAQASKLNRVFEVETSIKTKASNYIKKFIPEDKFTLEVKVSPLYRKSQNQNVGESSLPFYDLSETEALDEWEDPLYPIESLFQRIRQAKMTLKIDDGYTPKNISLFKESILKESGLMPGRDQIDVLFVAFSLVEKKVDLMEIFTNTEYIQTLSLIIFAFFGLTLFSKFTKQFKKRHEDAQKKDIAASSAPATPSFSASSPTAISPSLAPPQLQGDLNLSDPFQVSRAIKQKITDLMQDEHFPVLNDLILFEELLKDNVNAFAFLIYEFPIHIQEAIFKNGRDENWTKGFLEAGIPTQKIIMSLDQMLRERNKIQNHDLELLKVSLWRMKEDKLKEFLKDVDQDIAIGLLFHLPKELSLPVARKLYPGNWANILGQQEPYDFAVNNDAVTDLYNKSLQLVPYFEASALKVTKNKKDLLRYLFYVEPKEEEEIYSVTSNIYDLTAIRPPFYRFFKASNEDQEAIFNEYTVEQWALISFNISRKYRSQLNDLMDDKQKYLFSLSLKYLDETGTMDLITRGKLREEIGIKIFDREKQYKLNTQQEMTSEPQKDMAA